MTTCSSDANCHEKQATRLRALNRLHCVVQRWRAYEMSAFFAIVVIFKLATKGVVSFVWRQDLRDRRFVKGSWGKGGGGDRQNRRVAVCLCVFHLSVRIQSWRSMSLFVFSHFCRLIAPRVVDFRSLARRKMSLSALNSHVISRRGTNWSPSCNRESFDRWRNRLRLSCKLYCEIRGAFVNISFVNFSRVAAIYLFNR